LGYSFLPIPAKRYFTISEVSKLCGVKPHVLRYWEQEFTQLRPMKRRGNRRYYQLHEVKLIRQIRQIRQLLHEQRFTIVGARNRLQEIFPAISGLPISDHTALSQCKIQFDKEESLPVFNALPQSESSEKISADGRTPSNNSESRLSLAGIRHELITIRDLLRTDG